MSHSQAVSGHGSAPGHSKTLSGLKIDAHAFHKLKDQAMNKAKMLQAKACPCLDSISLQNRFDPLLVLHGAREHWLAWYDFHMGAGCKGNVTESGPGKAGRM